MSPQCEFVPSELYDPRTDALVNVIDIRAAVGGVTESNPVPADVVEVFLRDRPIDGGFFGRLFRSWGFLSAIPLPVAMGVFFRPKAVGFKTHTTLYWYVVAPETLGGASNEIVFLTATNQASAGPEALVRYEKGNRAIFNVFDGKLRRFVVSIPYSDPIYRSHEIQLPIQGKDYPTLYIANSTTGSGMDWRNEVFLYNPGTATFDLVWCHQFKWMQSASVSRTWAPIIEVPNGGRFGATHRVGYADARLVSDKVKTLLTKDYASFGENTIYEFDRIHLVENYELLAD